MSLELIKSGYAFPFPQIIDGRRVTTELYVNVFGVQVYRMVVWMTQDEINTFCGRHDYPVDNFIYEIVDNFIYEIVECTDIWDLREMAQWSEKKHRAQSLCY